VRIHRTQGAPLARTVAERAHAATIDQAADIAPALAELQSSRTSRLKTIRRAPGGARAGSEPLKMPATGGFAMGDAHDPRCAIADL
jgi:hypothetical protein